MSNAADNEDAYPTRVAVPDPYGEAALLLVESLIHGLITRSSLSVEDAVETVEIAMDVQLAIGAARGDANPSSGKTFNLLSAISASISADAALPGAARAEERP